MKWIGQHIWDFISRFRSDVYLEGTETGTIASGGNLGLDSDGKIVKATTSGGGLTITNATDNRIITSTGGTGLNAEANLTHTADITTVSSSLGGNMPTIELKNEHTDADGGLIKFIKSQDGADNDELGIVSWLGDDDGGNPQQFASITGRIADATDGDEGGKLELKVATNSTETQQALTATGLGTGSRVDVGLGYGTASTTTVAGTLNANAWGFLGGTANALITDDGDGTVTSESTLQYGSGLLSITSSTTDRPEILMSNSNTDAEAPIIHFVKTADGADDDELGEIKFVGEDESSGLQTYATLKAYIADATPTEEAGRLEFGVAEYNGNVTTGLKIDGDTNSDGDVDVVIGAGTSSNSSVSGNFSIGGTLVVASTTTLTSTTTASPNLNLMNTASNASSPAITFNKTAAGADGHDIARFVFKADNAADESTNFAKWLYEINTATDTDESGRAQLEIATSDGSTSDLQVGLKLTGSSSDNDVDVDLGYGVTAMTTIAGDLDIDGDNVTAAGALTITPGGAFSIAGGSSEIDLTTSGTVDINPGTLDVDVTGAATINTGNEIALTSAISKYYKYYNFQTPTFENQYSSGHTAGKILKYSPGGDTTLVMGQIYYLRNNGNWVSVNADDDGGGGPGYGDSQLLGVGVGGSSQTMGVLIEGFVRVPYTEILNVPGSGAVDGLPLYISTTAGHFDFTAPSDSGDFVRVVGYAVDDYDVGSGNMDVLVYFNPSKTWIELA